MSISDNDIIELHVLGDIELEIELPGTNFIWQLAILVEKCEAQLDHLEQINIAPRIQD